MYSPYTVAQRNLWKDFLICKRGTNVRMLFMMIAQPSKSWIVPIPFAHGYLTFWPTGHRQWGLEKKISTLTLTLRMETSKGCCLRSLLYSLLTHNVVAKYSRKQIIKFADNNMVNGLVHNNDKTVYRMEICLYCCVNNSLTLNFTKTKDLRLRPQTYFPGPWTPAVSSEKHNNLFLLRRLKGFGINITTLIDFFRCTKCSESETDWMHHGVVSNLTAQDLMLLQKTVEIASKILRIELPSLQCIFTTTCRTRAQSIILDAMHPAHALFSPLPSGKCLQSIKASPTHLKNSFFPQVVRILCIQE